jgi:hypothetical protein
VLWQVGGYFKVLLQSGEMRQKTIKLPNQIVNTFENNHLKGEFTFKLDNNKNI